jgi:hypothetical protein
MSAAPISTKSDRVLNADDKIFRITRGIALIVVPFLWLAFLILYAITPFLVPDLWFFNRKTDSGEPETNDVIIPKAVSLIFRFSGIGALIFVVVGFFNPEFIINVWPWTLSLLTGRVMCGWIALLAVGMLTMSTETRWSGWKVPVESIVIWHFLVLVAIVVNPADFKTSLINWYTILVGIMMISTFILYPMMELRKRKAN